MVLRQWSWTVPVKTNFSRFIHKVWEYFNLHKNRFQNMWRCDLIYHTGPNCVIYG